MGCVTCRLDLIDIIEQFHRQSLCGCNFSYMCVCETEKDSKGSMQLNKVQQYTANLTGIIMKVFPLKK